VIDDTDPDDYKIEEDKNADKNKVADADRQAENARMQGKTVADTIGQYYLHLAKSHIFGSQIQTILPINVSLDIYGISNLVPGDLCRVSYLPKRYRERTFFQILRVAQELNSGTWTTKLDMVCRFRNNIKEANHKKKASADVILNVNSLSNYRLAHWENYNAFPKYINELRPVDILDRNFDHIDAVLQFKTKNIKTGLLIPIPTNDLDEWKGNWSGYGAAFEIRGNWWSSAHGNNLKIDTHKTMEKQHQGSDHHPSYKLVPSNKDYTYYLVISNSGEQDQRWWCVTTIPPGTPEFKRLFDWDCDNIGKDEKKKIPQFK